MVRPQAEETGTPEGGGVLETHIQVSSPQHRQEAVRNLVERPEATCQLAEHAAKRVY